MASLCANSSPFITAAVEKREHAPEPSIPSFLFHSKKPKQKSPPSAVFLFCWLCKKILVRLKHPIIYT